MFNLNDTMRYFLCPGRTDMRKGISSLCGVVHEKMKSEVKNGDVFIFIGSNRRLMKLLHAEDGGMVMYVKRLEAGRFKLPEYDPESDSYPMEWRDLVMMVEGIQESPGQRLRRLRAERKEYPTVKLEVQLLHRLPPSLERSGKGGGRRWKPGFGSSGNTK